MGSIYDSKLKSIKYISLRRRNFKNLIKVPKIKKMNKISYFLSTSKNYYFVFLLLLLFKPVPKALTIRCFEVQKRSLTIKSNLLLNNLMLFVHNPYYVGRFILKQTKFIIQFDLAFSGNIDVISFRIAENDRNVVALFYFRMLKSKFWSLRINCFSWSFTTAFSK